MHSHAKEFLFQTFWGRDNLRDSRNLFVVRFLSYVLPFFSGWDHLRIHSRHSCTFAQFLPNIGLAWDSYHKFAQSLLFQKYIFPSVLTKNGSFRASGRLFYQTFRGKPKSQERKFFGSCPRGKKNSHQIPVLKKAKNVHLGKMLPNHFPRPFAQFFFFIPKGKH